MSVPSRERRLREMARTVLAEWAAEAREWSHRANLGGPAEPCVECRQGTTWVIHPWGRHKTSGGVSSCVICAPLETIESLEETKRQAFAEAERRLGE